LSEQPAVFGLPVPNGRTACARDLSQCSSPSTFRVSSCAARSYCSGGLKTDHSGTCTGLSCGSVSTADAAEPRKPLLGGAPSFPATTKQGTISGVLVWEPVVDRTTRRLGVAMRASAGSPENERVRMLRELCAVRPAACGWGFESARPWARDSFPVRRTSSSGNPDTPSTQHLLDQAVAGGPPPMRLVTF
jgi:hypothetical protein